MQLQLGAWRAAGRRLGFGRLGLLVGAPAPAAQNCPHSVGRGLASDAGVRCTKLDGTCRQGRTSHAVLKPSSLSLRSPGYRRRCGATACRAMRTTSRSRPPMASARSWRCSVHCGRRAWHPARSATSTRMRRPRRKVPRASGRERTVVLHFTHGGRQVGGPTTLPTVPHTTHLCAGHVQMLG